MRDGALAEINERAQASNVTERSPGSEKSCEPLVRKRQWQILFAVPLAVALAFALHRFTSKNEPPAETHLYANFLGGLFVASIGTAVL